VEQQLREGTLSMDEASAQLPLAPEELCGFLDRSSLVAARWKRGDVAKLETAMRSHAPHAPKLGTLTVVLQEEQLLLARISAWAVRGVTEGIQQLETCLEVEGVPEEERATLEASLADEESTLGMLSVDVVRWKEYEYAVHQTAGLTKFETVERRQRGAELVEEMHCHATEAAGWLMRMLDEHPTGPEATRWKDDLSRLSARAISGKAAECVELEIMVDACREAGEDRADVIEELTTAQFTLDTLRMYAARHKMDEVRTGSEDPEAVMHVREAIPFARHFQQELMEQTRANAGSADDPARLTTLLEQATRDLREMEAFVSGAGALRVEIGGEGESEWPEVELVLSSSDEEGADGSEEPVMGMMRRGERAPLSDRSAAAVFSGTTPEAKEEEQEAPQHRRARAQGLRRSIDATQAQVASVAEEVIRTTEREIATTSLAMQTPDLSADETEEMARSLEGSTVTLDSARASRGRNFDWSSDDPATLQAELRKAEEELAAVRALVADLDDGLSSTLGSALDMDDLSRETNEELTRLLAAANASSQSMQRPSFTHADFLAQVEREQARAGEGLGEEEENHAETQESESADEEEMQAVAAYGNFDEVQSPFDFTLAALKTLKVAFDAVAPPFFAMAVSPRSEPNAVAMARRALGAHALLGAVHHKKGLQAALAEAPDAMRLSLKQALGIYSLEAARYYKHTVERSENGSAGRADARLQLELWSCEAARWFLLERQQRRPQSGQSDDQQGQQRQQALLADEVLAEVGGAARRHLASELENMRLILNGRHQAAIRSLEREDGELAMSQAHYEASKVRQLQALSHRDGGLSWADEQVLAAHQGSRREASLAAARYLNGVIETLERQMELQQSVGSVVGAEQTDKLRSRLELASVELATLACDAVLSRLPEVEHGNSVSSAPRNTPSSEEAAVWQEELAWIHEYYGPVQRCLTFSLC
jgi:hypothetical protein